MRANTSGLALAPRCLLGSTQQRRCAADHEVRGPIARQVAADQPAADVIALFALDREAMITVESYAQNLPAHAGAWRSSKHNGTLRRGVNEEGCAQRRAAITPMLPLHRAAFIKSGE